MVSGYRLLWKMDSGGLFRFANRERGETLMNHAEPWLVGSVSGLRGQVRVALERFECLTKSFAARRGTLSVPRCIGSVGGGCSGHDDASLEGSCDVVKSLG